MWRRLSLFILSCAVAVAILASMLYLVWDELIETLTRADPRYLVLAESRPRWAENADPVWRGRRILLRLWFDASSRAHR